MTIMDCNKKKDNTEAHAISIFRSVNDQIALTKPEQQIKKSLSIN